MISVYDEMEDTIDNARLNDECSYDVYSQMVDLIREAEERDLKLCNLVSDMLIEMRDYELIGCCRYEKRARELGIEVNAWEKLS